MQRAHLHMKAYHLFYHIYVKSSGFSDFLWSASLNKQSLRRQWEIDNFPRNSHFPLLLFTRVRYFSQLLYCILRCTSSLHFQYNEKNQLKFRSGFFKFCNYLVLERREYQEQRAQLIDSQCLIPIIEISAQPHHREGISMIGLLLLCSHELWLLAA